jgi:hypothetical protein
MTKAKLLRVTLSGPQGCGKSIVGRELDSMRRRLFKRYGIRFRIKELQTS